MNKENRNFYISQIQTDVALISFMTVISVFFIGALLPQFNAYDLSIRIPLSFLIISTFTFLFSTLILSNTTPEIINEKYKKAEKHISYGYILSEYFGVYLFVLSIPLLINVISNDLYLRIITLIAAIVGMGFYQIMGFSVIENHFPKTYKLYSVVTLLLGILLFVSQIYQFYFTEFSIVFLAFILLITILASRSKNGETKNQQ